MCLVESLIERDQQRSMANRLQQTWFEQAVEMAQCLRFYRQSYGLKHVPSQVADAVRTALQVLVHQLDHSREVRQAFMEILRFVVALSQKFKPAADAVHAVQILSQRGAVMLPTEAVVILGASETREI